MSGLVCFEVLPIAGGALGRIFGADTRATTIAAAPNPRHEARQNATPAVIA